MIDGETIGTKRLPARAKIIGGMNPHITYIFYMDVGVTFCNKVFENIWLNRQALSPVEYLSQGIDKKILMRMALSGITAVCVVYCSIVHFLNLRQDSQSLS